jgi:ATP-dependent Clp protease ATP-binding subunit ClpC
MPEQDDIMQSLAPGAQRIVELAGEKQREHNHAQSGLNHWLSALLERNGPMAESMTRGLEAQAALSSVRRQLQQGNTGEPLDAGTVAQRAVEHAQARGKSQAAERDVCAVILAAAGYEVTPEASGTYVSTISSAQASPVSGSPSSVEGAFSTNGGGGGGAVPAGSTSYRTRAARPTPTLDHFGRDLTRQAQEGKLITLVGREGEIQQIIETLCRRTKPNPVLVGPAGTGKTTIVEGLAQRVVRGEVPEKLRGSRVIAIQPSSLVAGASVQGELEKRMQALLMEASQEGILLFIDEVHSLIGAGGMPGTDDMASLLKPALARGDLRCIAATTDDEYRRFIEPDKALERRFNRVYVNEPDHELTFAVLATIRDEFARRDNVHVSDGILRWLVDFAGRFMRNRYFPDKGVDLLEQCVAHAVAEGKSTVELADAEAVVARMVGMPPSIERRLEELRRSLIGRALLTDADAAALLDRLDVTIASLDVRSVRPNAVVLLIGEAEANARGLAEVISKSLFGAEGRIVTIDFGFFTHPADVSRLVGAAPGYIGYSESLPLHEVARMPWCVLVCENVHACHPAVLQVLTQGLASGFITDSRSKNIYLSDTVTLLTARIDVEAHRAMGFRQAGEVQREPAREAAARELGEALVEQCDFVCSQVLAVGDTQRRWLQDSLLSDLSKRFHALGLDLQWDRSLLDWLLAQQKTRSNQRDWERLVDGQITAILKKHLPPPDAPEARPLVVKYDGGAIHVETPGGNKS